MSDSSSGAGSTELGERMRSVREAVLASADDSDVLLLTDAIVEDDPVSTPTVPPPSVAVGVTPASAVAEMLVGGEQESSPQRVEIIRGEVRAWLDRHGPELVRRSVAEQLAREPTVPTGTSNPK